MQSVQSKVAKFIRKLSKEQHSSNLALLAQRIADAEAFQDDAALPAPAQASLPAPTEAQHAVECMRKTRLALRRFAEIECQESRAMRVEFVHDFRSIELEQTLVQSNTLMHTFAAQKAAAELAQAMVLAQAQTAASSSRPAVTASKAILVGAHNGIAHASFRRTY